MIASVYLFYIKDNKILLLLRKNTGYMDGMYGLPAGHVEDNEPLTHAAAREIKEELDIDLNPKDVNFVHTMHRKGNDIRIDFFFVVDNLNQEPKNNEPHKCEHLTWFPVHELPENIIPYIQTAIYKYLDKVPYSEVGW